MAKSRLQSMPVHALRAFEAASRLGSFKAAANELSVTPAAISHQIRSLEMALGLALFDRLHRSLQLTNAGEQLARAAQESFRILESALTALAEQGRLSGPKTLNVSAAPSIATKWLAPRLYRFHALHPQIDLRLQADDRRVDLVREAGTDVALRYGPQPKEGGIEVIRLWPPGRIILVCAQAIVDRGQLQSPADVPRFTLLRTAQPSAIESTLPNWTAWLQAAGIEGEVRGPYFGSTQLTIEAAMAGEGLALAPEILVADDLRSGRLAQPFDLSIADPFCYWLLCRSDRRDETRIRAFVKWVMEEAATDSRA
jgi:DNA-binding transcriptional LysR family regulator